MYILRCNAQTATFIQLLAFILYHIFPNLQGFFDNFQKNTCFFHFFMIDLLTVSLIKKLGGAKIMAKCAVCGKSQSNGNKLSITRSHISKRSPRTWKPNLRSVKAIMENGETKRVHVCAKCLKDGKIKRA